MWQCRQVSSLPAASAFSWQEPQSRARKAWAVDSSPGDHMRPAPMLAWVSRGGGPFKGLAGAFAEVSTVRIPIARAPTAGAL